MTFSWYKFLGALTITLSFIYSVQAVDFYDGRPRAVVSSSYSKIPLSDIKIKNLTEMAIQMAQFRLSKNPKDKIGLLMVKLANHFSPRDRDILLLRGRLRYNIPIKSPKKNISRKEFLSLLKKSVNSLPSRNSDMTRHLRVLFYALIREFNPEDEDAIVALISFEDKGIPTDLNVILEKNIHNAYEVQYDPRDERYVISNVKKTLFVPANVPWTDSWIKVKAGKIVRITATRMWSMGNGPFPYCDAEGYDISIEQIRTRTSKSLFSKKKAKKQTTRIVRKYKGDLSANPGCLMARIGKKSYRVGKEAVFQAESSGILYFGPYEWDNYADNTGKIQVNVEVSDR